MAAAPLAEHQRPRLPTQAEEEKKELAAEEIATPSEEEIKREENLESARDEEQQSIPSIPNEEEKIAGCPYGEGLIIKIKLERLEEEGSEEKKA